MTAPTTDSREVIRAKIGATPLSLSDADCDKIIAASLPKKRHTTHWKAVAKAAQLAVHDCEIDLERVSQCLDAESDAVRALTGQKQVALDALAAMEGTARRYFTSAGIGWLLFVGTLAAYARVVFR